MVDQRRWRPDRTRPAERDSRRDRARRENPGVLPRRERRSDAARIWRVHLARVARRQNERRYGEDPLASRTYVDSAIRFSPDGTKLLAWLWGWPDQATGNVPKPEFWILPSPTGKPYQVLPSLARASPVAASFDWFPDGRRIVVSLWDEVTAGSHLWVADTHSDTTVPLTETPGSESRPVLTPDGQRVAFTSRSRPPTF